MANDGADGRLQKPLRASMLLAEYGALVTPRQREALRLHYDEDWSLSEIASHFGTTRQGIGDLMARGTR